MEKTVYLRLRSPVAAQARVNGLVVARVGPAGGELCVPVHEMLLEGANVIVLTVFPEITGRPFMPRHVVASVFASAQLLLTRLGRAVHVARARCLAETTWQAPTGSLVTQPADSRCTVDLPVKFPRWRWLDLAPIKSPWSRHGRIADFLCGLAVSMARGDAEPFLGAAAPRFSDLAVAYRRPRSQLQDALRSRIAELHAGSRLRPAFAELDGLLLVPSADGRLLECLGRDGGPVLRTEPGPDGASHSWPVQLALIEDRCVIVR